MCVCKRARHTQAFDFFDNKGKGYVTLADLKRGLAAMQIKVDGQELEEMIKEADQIGDGKVSFEDFKSIAALF